MLRRIPNPRWFIMFAAILALASPSGDSFWDFNIMEAFATFAIVVTIGIAIRGWRNEKRRQNALILFPDNWSANYDKDKNVVRFQIGVNVLMPFHAYSLGLHILAGGKRVQPQNVDSVSPMGEKARKEGRITLWGEIPISQIPEGVTELEMKGDITLDHKIKKSSDKRKVIVTDIAWLESHTAGSQT